MSGLARRLLGDTTRTESLTEEVFLRLWHEPHRFCDGPESLRATLLRVTHGRAADTVRRDAARGRHPSGMDRVIGGVDRGDAGESAEGHEPDRGEPDRELALELAALTQIEQVRRALTGLPPTERTVIELTYYGANTYRQVAALLDIPDSAVRARLRSGLRHLHTVLIKHGDHRNRSSWTE